MEKKLQVKDLRVSFRTQGGIVKAVRGIDFDLYKGETLAIVGESGSGKSVTSKAIIGILAGNSIVESGEILYDGQDLIQISEEDFHKLRGDNIAMIFQDPMSSLNPFMRIGKQLTEAMLLKNKASKKKAKKMFNFKLALLQKYMTLAGVPAEESAELCSTFDNFCINSIKHESAYNETYRAAVELHADIVDFVTLCKKNAKIDYSNIVKRVLKNIPLTIHPDIVVMSGELTTAIEELTVISQSKSKTEGAKVLEHLKTIDDILEVASNKEKPNYFALGYYTMCNPDASLDDMPIDELNNMVRKYLDDNFMLDFIAKATKAIKYSVAQSIEQKKAILELTEQSLEFYRNETLVKSECIMYNNRLGTLVSEAINRLVVSKNSVEYTFSSSISRAVKQYFHGIKHNPIAQRKFERSTEQYNKLIAKGKEPDWKVVPPVIVDIDMARKNIRNVLHALRASIRNDIELVESFDYSAETIKVIDFLKQQASNAVHTVTKKMAKFTAIKLLEEVGIPEPALRYRQYPFEFSGGMRQRIVIAIALAANPDILICDEPTTALDVTIQAQILELINKLKVERQLTVIFITHDLGVVANMADRIAVMYAGKIVEKGTAEDIFYDPRHPYTWALLASMPDLDTTEKLDAIPGTPPNMIYPPKGDAFAARNAYALDIDFECEPPMFDVSDTHSASTWLLHPDAPKVNPPKIVTERIARSKSGVKEDS